jgi:hypothetical protein
MAYRLSHVLAALAVAGGTLALAAPALAGSDAFDRPKLGPSWVSVSGKLSISADQLVGTTLGIGYLQKSSGDSAASAVVFLGGTDLEYGAVAVGNIPGGSNAFLKIQSQDGAGTFDHAAFYTGNNGTGNFFALASAVPSPAILDATFCGTVAYMRITSAAGVQTYSYDYGTTFGSGGGLGTYGSVSLDNYVGFKTNCSAAAVATAIPAASLRHDKDLSH